MSWITVSQGDSFKWVVFPQALLPSKQHSTTAPAPTQFPGHPLQNICGHTRVGFGSVKAEFYQCSEQSGGDTAIINLTLYVVNLKFKLRLKHHLHFSSLWGMVEEGFYIITSLHHTVASLWADVSWNAPVTSATWLWVPCLLYWNHSKALLPSLYHFVLLVRG